MNSAVAGFVNSAASKDTTPLPHTHTRKYMKRERKKKLTAFDTVVQSIKNGYQVKTLGQNALASNCFR